MLTADFVPFPLQRSTRWLKRTIEVMSTRRDRDQFVPGQLSSFDYTALISNHGKTHGSNADTEKDARKEF